MSLAELFDDGVAFVFAVLLTSLKLSGEARAFLLLVIGADATIDGSVHMRSPFRIELFVW